MLLRVDGVAKRFIDGESTRWVLRDIDFAVDDGETVALWGPSGAGKSTLLGIVAGITTPDAGGVTFARPGEPPFAVSAASERDRVRFRRRSVGYVFQFFNLVPTLTAAENVLLPLELNGLPSTHAVAVERLGELGVGHCAARFPETLSGGEQQRVAIARAIVHRPPIVLADEPTGNLDSASAAIVTDALWRATERAACALVIATHNERIAARADRMIDLS